MLLSNQLQIGGSNAPSSGLVYLLEWLTELRKTDMLTSLVKDVIKDTDKQPDERYKGVVLRGSQAQSLQFPWR